VLELDGKKAELGQARPTGFDTEVQLPSNTAVPEAATHLLVFSRNQFGEYPSPGSVVIRDAVLPKGKPGSITFEDEDGEKGEVSGVVRITRAEDEEKLDDYSLHWGRSATRKTASGSYIRDIPKGSGTGDLTHTIGKSTKPPEGATHLLVYSKNEFGDHPSPSSLKFVDNTKACLGSLDADCVDGAHLSPDEDPSLGKIKAKLTVRPAKDATNLTAYAIYWSSKSCELSAPLPAAHKLQPLLKELPSDGSLEYSMVDVRVHPKARFIAVFSKNKYGESEFCTSYPVKDELVRGRGEGGEPATNVEEGAEGSSKAGEL